MAQIALDEQRVKELCKQAVLEVFREQKDLFYDLLAEVIEDLALVNAIKEGEATDSVSRSEVFRILENVV